MTVIGDLVARSRVSDDAAQRQWYRAHTRTYSSEKFCVNAWKAGNLLRHYGVRGGMAVGVLDAPKTPATPATDWTHDPEQTPIPESLLAFFGAALLGAPVRFDPPTAEAAAEPLAVHALVGPTAWLDAYDCGPQCTALGYGDSPADPSVVHFEKQLWSENPIEPPDRVAPEDVALLTADAEYTHRDLLDAATAVVEEYALTSDDSVAVRAPLSWPGTVVAGVLAPLSVGATIRVGDADEASAVVATDGEWGGRRIDPAAVYEGRT